MAPVSDNTARSLPDIANDPHQAQAGALDWVGMGQIEMPVSLVGADGRAATSPARVDAFVNLRRPDVRGIHMSRLYLHVDAALSSEPVTPASLRRLLKDFLESHADLSDRAMLRLRFEHLVRRKALASDNSGWKSYPVTLTAVLDRGHFALELALQVQYSSTCPCSAALARQLIQQQFAADFADGAAPERDAVLAWLGSEQGIVATPHSQRSIAEVKLRLLPSFCGLPVIEAIDRIEDALKTPVQTAVKRVDEQAFALLNGQNLMFCEDAARRIQGALLADEHIADFWVRVSHQESLHPHDAVAVATRGVAGGYTSLPDGLQPR
jgi:GTP cyclohydrolase IB